MGGTTIHRLCGLGDGRFGSDSIASRILNDGKMAAKLRKMNTLIIDEASMMSCKIFDTIDHVLRKVRGVNVPFGQIQLIVSGDFYQLAPVPNLHFGDNGDYCFMSSVWEMALPHHVKLNIVHRQEEVDLVKAVRELSVGSASTDTNNLLQRYLQQI